MKKLSKYIFGLMISVLIGGILSSCGLFQSVSHEHDKLVELYQKADAARSNAAACYDMNGGKVRDSFKAFNKFLDANKQTVDAWKSNKLDPANKAFNNAKSSLKSSLNDDLNTAVENGGTPTDMANGFALQINAYTEAPWVGMDTVALTSLQDLIEEAYSTSYGCIKDWNDAVSAYNIERSRIASLSDSGRIIGDAANALGVTDLPRKLPYYESPDNSKPIGSDFTNPDPTATPEGK